MRRAFLAKLLVLSVAMVGLNGFAAEGHGSSDEAIALVKKGIAYIKANGTEKAYAAISDANGQFVDRDLYLFVFDLSGKTLAHGVNPKLIGKNLMEMKDNEGKAFIKEFIEIGTKKGKGWVDYKWPHPVTKQLEQKSSYIEKVDADTIIGCGIYK